MDPTGPRQAGQGSGSTAKAGDRAGGDLHGDANDPSCHKHARPGERLQGNPMQADRAAKGESHDDASHATVHAHETRERSPIRQSA